MDDDFLSGDYDSPRRDNLFAWTIFILLLVGLALVCWMGSFYVFGHPENPTSYQILKKVGKIDAPKRFEVTAAPAGEFLTPEKLYDRYAGLSALDLKRENDELMRNYLRNYTNTKKLVPYVIGRFNVLDSFELTSADLFNSGVVALAQAVDYPAVLIEHVYTADHSDVPKLRKMLMTGLDIKLMKSLDLSAVVHVRKIFDGRLQFTVVPLLYGTYSVAQGTGSFSLKPPGDVNLSAGLPILETKELQEGFRAYAQYQRGETPEKETLPEVVRVEPTPAPRQTPQPPKIAQATPKPTPAKIAESTPQPTPEPTPERASELAVETTPVPTPHATPSPLLAARSTPAPEEPPDVTPAPAAPVVSPEGVPLQPFLVSSPAEREGGSWRTYAPGKMPRGKLIRSDDADELAERGLDGERVYLQGDFVVTASGDRRAVLRSSRSRFFGGSGNAPELDKTRIIVEYPSGTKPPVQGALFSRDELRPFEITDVQRGERGEINVYVREVTAP